MNRVSKIKLINWTYEPDELGQMVPTPDPTEVFAYVNDISQNEYFNAGQNGLKPRKSFDVLITEYGDQEDIEWNGDQYRVYRSYTNMKSGRVELYTELRVGENDTE